MPKIFSSATLGKFEDAAASIPLRPLNKAFENADIRPGTDPGGLPGSRKEQFRRFVAGVDQRDRRQLDRLGRALGALIGEVAESKVDFLVRAAASDGFAFVDGVFAPAKSSAGSTEVAPGRNDASIDDCMRKLRMFASDDTKDATRAGTDVLASVCGIILHRLGKPAPRKTATPAEVVRTTLDALDPSAPSRKVMKSGRSIR